LKKLNMDYWKVSLEQHGTGRLYSARDYGAEFAYGNFGTVCAGTGRNSILGRNGRSFGKLVCATLGFSSVLFIGVEPEYREFMDKRYRSHDSWIGSCTPDFSVAGASCDKNGKCKPLDINVHGGACVKGASEVYVHCDQKKPTIYGQWSEWINTDEGTCAKNEFFRQQYRKCISDETSNPKCFGPWLQLIPCGLCKEDRAQREEYNDEYVDPDWYYNEGKAADDYALSESYYAGSSSSSSSSSSYLSSYSYDTTTYGPEDYTISDYAPYLRRKRSDDNQKVGKIDTGFKHPICSCQLAPEPVLPVEDEYGFPLCNPDYHNWRDSQGRSCDYYTSRHYCSILTAKHSIRPWNRRHRYAKFDQFENDRYTALNCPRCGCRKV